MKIVKIVSFYAKILKDFRKFQSDRKFMIAECAYTVPRELVSKNVILLLRISSHFVQRYTLPTGGNRKATCQSCVKNYLPELLADYLPEHCNNIFYELL